MTENQKTLVVPEPATSEIPFEKIGVKAGLMLSAAFISYFMIMKFFNFIDSPVAWGFNIVILFGGIALTYRYCQSETKLNVEYFPGLILGCIATAAAVIPFTLFVYIYFSQAEPSLLFSLKDNIFFMGEQITPLRIATATLVEGISSGVIISFMMMQYFRSGFRRKGDENRMHG